MAIVELSPAQYEGTLALYLATPAGELPDLEIAASAAIHWAKGIKAAAAANDPSAEYRVTLVAARPGSSNWIAKLEELREKVEKSKINRTAEQIKEGWQKVPLLVRVGLGLAVVVPPRPFQPSITSSETAALRKLKSKKWKKSIAVLSMIRQ